MSGLPKICPIQRLSCRLSHPNQHQVCELNSNVAQTSKSYAPTQVSLPQRGGTSIMLLHHGQPRTPFYLHHHLVEQLKHDFYLPSMGVEKLCKMLYSRKAKMLDQCLNNSTQHPPFSEAIQNFAVMLEKAVNTVMPEFGTAKCSTSLFYDQANVQDNFKEILSGPCENVIFVSMYPFYNQHLTTPLFQAVNTFLQSNTTKVITKFTTDDSKDKDGFYIAKGNKPISFNCSTLDELAQSQGFVEFWAEKIKNELESNVDGIIFAVPLPLSGRSAYTKSVEDAAQRIMYTIYKSYPEAVPWRIAYFQSWNQFCPLLTKATLNNQHRDLRKKRGGNGQVLVVPIANLLHDFDTQTVLPSLIQRLENTKLLTAASLTNPTEEDKHEKSSSGVISKALVYSLTEIVKSRLLSVKSSAEW